MVEEIEIFRKSVLEHQPIILMTVGSFPYEFVRRVFEIEPKKGPKYWSNANLEDEFEQSIANFNTKKTNRLPLLRRIIIVGKPPRPTWEGYGTRRLPTEHYPL